MVPPVRHCPICGRRIGRRAVQQKRRFCSTDCYHVARRRELDNRSDDLEKGMFCPNEQQIKYLCSVIRGGWDARTFAERQGYRPLGQSPRVPTVYHVQRDVR